MCRYRQLSTIPIRCKGAVLRQVKSPRRYLTAISDLLAKARAAATTALRRAQIPSPGSPQGSYIAIVKSSIKSAVRSIEQLRFYHSRVLFGFRKDFAGCRDTMGHWGGSKLGLHTRSATLCRQPDQASQLLRECHCAGKAAVMSANG